MGTANESIRRTFGRTAPLREMLAVALLAAGVGLGACARDAVGPGRAVPDGPSFTLNPACDSALGGVVHHDSVLVPETWSRANNPHRVDTFISIEGAGVLTLQPGVLVCFNEDGALLAENGGRLVANGLDTARIVLTAADPARGWWGVHMTGTPASPSSLRNVRLEHTDLVTAFSTHDYHAAIIDSTVFRQNEGGLYLWGRGTRMSRSRVDTVTSSAGPAVTLGNLITFEQNAIRGAAGVGLAVLGTNGIYLLGGRIEGSGGVGLRVTTTGPGFVDTDPVRVTGGATYPAELVVSAFPRIYPTLANQDSLLGNARDTLVVTGGILQAFAYPRAALPWRVTGDITVQYYGILSAGPGASLAFDSAVSITAASGGRVVARGSAAAPVLFTGAGGATWDGVTLWGSPTLTSYLTNVRIEHVDGATAVTANDNHAVAIDSAVFRQNGGAVALWSQGSRLSRSRVDTTLASVAAVKLGADAILESTLIRGSSYDGVGIHSSTVQVRSCEVRESRWWGIVVWVAAPVHNCNVVGSPWGLVNVSGDTIDATDNWWGDAGGPGVVGNSASGPVTYTPWRTTPYVLPYVP